MQNSSTQSLGFNDLWFRLIGIPVIGLLIPAMFFNISFNSAAYFSTSIVSTAYVAFYWVMFRHITIFANTKYASLKLHKERLFFIIIRCLIIIILLCPIIHKVVEPLFFTSKLQGYGLLEPTIFQIYSANITIHLAIASIYESIRNFSLWEQSETEKERLEKEHITSQLEGLKSQVNPHFLFNSLNTLISIIPEDSERSVRFVRQLSKIYRYFLDTTSEKTVPLKQEMNFVNSYTFLLKERFGESLHLYIDDKNACEDCEIVPFSLQLLLENCIKHNIISQDKPLYINILVNKNYLTVKNNFQPKNQVQASTGVGLKNIENRYALLSKEKINIEKTETEFCVTLPLL